MSKFITTRSFATVLDAISSAEDASYPDSNLNQKTKPYRPWKEGTNIATTDYGGLDIGGLGQTIDTVFVYNLNVASVKIQADATPGNATPAYDSGALTAEKDPYSQMYKLAHEVPGSRTDRYVWARPATTTTTNGAIDFQVGAIFVATALNEWTHNPEFDWQLEQDWPAANGSRIGNPFTRITIPPSRYLETMRSQIETLMGYGQHLPFVIWPDSDETSRFYLVKRVGVLGVKQTDVGLIATSQGLVMEEVH